MMPKVGGFFGWTRRYPGQAASRADCLHRKIQPTFHMNPARYVTGRVRLAETRAFLVECIFSLAQAGDVPSRFAQ